MPVSTLIASKIGQMVLPISCRTNSHKVLIAFGCRDALEFHRYEDARERIAQMPA
jgi:hypothetical protein